VAIYAADVGLFAHDDLAPPIPPPEIPSFSGIVADALSPAAGLAQTADTSAAELGGVDGAHLDDTYQAVLGGAADALQSETDATSSSPAGPLTDSGGRVDLRAAQVRGYLPGPETSVQMNLIDPPHVPAPGDTGAPGLGPPPPQRPNEGGV
jgi:hypothetical protein